MTRSLFGGMPIGRLLDGLLPLPDEQITSAQPRRCVVERFSLATRPSLLLVLNAQKCPEDRERDQEPISRPLRAVCATDHGQGAGLRAVLVIVPPKVSVVYKLRRILSENTMICAVFPPARAVGVAALTFTQGAAKLRG